MAILINYFNHVTEQKRAKRLGFSGKKVRNLAYMLTTVKSMFPLVLLKLRWHAYCVYVYQNYQSNVWTLLLIHCYYLHILNNQHYETLLLWNCGKCCLSERVSYQKDKQIKTILYLSFNVTLFA